MTKFKKIFALTAMVLTISAASLSVYAASNYNTPAEAVAGLTGRTLENVLTEKSENGSTYGTIASEAGVLTEFKIELFEIKKDQLAEQVAAGKMTQSEADVLLSTWQQNQTDCTGDGSGMQGNRGIGSGFSGMFGNKQQDGSNSRSMNGNGQQNATGSGRASTISQNRLHNQSCLITE
ncbi:MAG TPA: hypothetical protein VFF80_01450 [Bacillota bacterium]|nr:hypothetical protein [Bacillota bacterium]